MTVDNDPMAEIRASFFIESEELLEALQDGLQLMEDGAADNETINVVFRAVHSIKGGAGAFGLEGLVHFAHRYETVLDEVRAGRLQVETEALKVFFQAADHLSDLVRISRDNEPLPDEETEVLLTALDAFLGDASPAASAVEEVIDFQPMGVSLDLGLAAEGDGGLPDLNALPPLDFGAAPRVYEITFTPQADLFDTGNEPATLLRNLQQLGKAKVVCDSSRLPPIDQLRPDVPHLSWTVTLETDVEESEIASIFEFVEGLCQLDIKRQGDWDSAELPPLPDLPPLDPASAKVEETAPKAPTEAAPAPLPTQTEPGPTAAAPAPPPQGAPTAAKSVVRVDLDRIERLVNLVGELVINQAMLSQSLEHSGLSPHSDAMSGLEEFQRLTRDIQDSVMMIRAQPVKSLFQRMSRIVREASAAVEKDVRLVTTGEATEVDKTVIERLADPLTHMIRNAVDHGLESKEARLAAGKPAQGKVNLSAAHRSGRVVIEIADDGAGIDRPKVLQLAIDKGLIPPDSSLSDSEIDNLLFLPGFSTADKVSNLSGRGVGMDVVRTSIQALGGRITTTSQPGQGTTFSISLPLTLAVLDGMVIEVAEETLVLPLNLVIETLTLQSGDVEMVRPGRNVVRVRSGFVPLFDLGAALGYRPPLDDFEGSVVLLIANEDETNAALLIDNILDQRQVVIKGLDESFYRAPGIAAATILGDGQIALILDPSDIISTAIPKPGLPQTGTDAGVPA
ncbi:chemotaxis protein CheA [Sulfitobacter mediterraneus]|uniref:chemotaxis protein CheA n=1 Tax=Sulfitobacter mediterraneus TaxID=83219 RepID=UPI0019312A22|nr:chemotaxis protein CheA [Sulfitobacter mediterraneus]MBM1632165.1 chemotaxis protein CheA [Sulfitobacter mediterraneus]MBM1639980.1 chemotaxis protein CheA [Sulfitobacter mediterraneus]MBM1644029.1 chemotaxis protein CheA [Sulfitobacter mediterraneus]MBM1648075.1 chemotaxis protein CheA [Sulfitobacter mediterraneus]MBM1652120.1 chemotaxis protein CheA [Sulfitobacter mediterraneus]